MKLLMIRHSITPGNLANKYIGSTDQPLAPEGIKRAEEFGKLEGFKRVYISKYIRTFQTAEIIFPDAEKIVVPGLEEMDFGDFEGRSADEMENDAAYRKWVDDMCLSRVPNGERIDEVIERTVNAFNGLTDKCEDDILALTVHGGTIMSLMYALDEKKLDYYSYGVKNCCGFVCEVCREDEKTVLKNAVRISSAIDAKEALK